MVVPPTSHQASSLRRGHVSDQEYNDPLRLILSRQRQSSVAHRLQPHAHPDRRNGTRAAPMPAARQDGSTRHAARCSRKPSPRRHAQNTVADCAVHRARPSPTLYPRPSAQAPIHRGSQTPSQTERSSRILQHLQTQPLFIEIQGPGNVANERDRIDKAHRGPAAHGISPCSNPNTGQSLPDR